jgi:hypothetical protein
MMHGQRNIKVDSILEPTTCERHVYLCHVIGIIVVQDV